MKLYYEIGLSNQEILTMLAHKHQIIISIRTLKRLMQEMSLCRRKKQSDLLEVASFIERQITKSGSLHGYRWMYQKCRQEGLLASHETIRQLLSIFDKEGVELRSHRRLRRRQYHCAGPNHIWHIDGYDKLKQYGFAIHGCIDGFSRKIMWMEACRTNNDPKVIASYFLNVVESLGGCPQKIRADRGTENGHVRDMQLFLRKTDDEAENDSFMYGKSTTNQRIEWWWGMLRKQNAQYWMNIFEELKDEGLFDGDYLDKALLQFTFMNTIQVCLVFQQILLKL